VGGRERYLFKFHIGSVNPGIYALHVDFQRLSTFFDVFMPGYCQLNKEYVLEPTIIKIKGIAREII
jgi:hypothetical protein